MRRFPRLLLAALLPACASSSPARAPAATTPTTTSGASLPPVTVANGIDLGQLTVQGDVLALDGVTLATAGAFTWKAEDKDGEWIRPLQAALEERRWQHPPEHQGTLSTRGYLRLSADPTTTHERIHPVLSTAASVGIRNFRLDATGEVFGIAVSLPAAAPPAARGLVLLLEVTAKDVRLTARNPTLPPGPANPLRQTFAPAQLAELTTMFAAHPEWAAVPLNVTPTMESTSGLLLQSLAAVLRGQPAREGRFDALVLTPWLR